MRSSAAICVVLCAILAACDEETGPNISGVHGLNIVRIEISPKLDTLFVADTIRESDRLQMTAEVIGWTGTAMGNIKLAWSSSDPNVATVDENGLVTPTGFGTTIIQASATKIARATIVVLPAARSVQVTPTSASILVGSTIEASRDTLRLRATALDNLGNAIAGIRFAWSSSAPSIATVDATGLVSARALGVTTITAQAGTRSATASVRVAQAAP
ncbi:MAG TPA: Ig-like domain-containing protein [Gemmatimonadaceae bacterium]|nr:Ig-like domain-containing protein [Gemmatimonadaceae bacterium]